MRHDLPWASLQPPGLALQPPGTALQETGLSLRPSGPALRLSGTAVQETVPQMSRLRVQVVRYPPWASRPRVVR